ncbi:MAG: hypothetical protein ACRDVW_07715 [Acidimicrobiales bacterium]
MSSPGSFRYAGHDIEGSTLSCSYVMGDRSFTEQFEIGEGDWSTAGAAEAARLVYLLTGVSYYKTAAPRSIEVDVALRTVELDLLRDYYVKGLGEFAFTNGIALRRLSIDADVEERPPARYEPSDPVPLVPFGGGIDSIVTVETLKRRHLDPQLFVVAPHTAPYGAIEGVLPLTGLPVVRTTRHLDPQLFEPRAESGFLQGHVPITGIITALAVLAAVGRGFGTVVLSNEWSASSGNLVVGNQVVNHQYSKSREFEVSFARVVRGALGNAPRVFSLLRPYTEVWVAQRFARLTEYHRSFHSCNRAFTIDPAARLERWCGECDKCCFIDLVLSPFLSRVELESIFGGREPLGREDLYERFAVLVGLSADPKPFECVGEVGECRAAASLAAERGDRRGDEVLQRIAAQLPSVSAAEVERLMTPHTPHDIPDDFATEDLLV